MAISRILLSDLKTGKCSSVVEVHLLRFWEARNVKRGGELMCIDMLLMDVNLKKNLIASYVDDETSMLHEMAKSAWITVLGETTSHNLAFSVTINPLNSVHQKKNVLNPKPLILETIF